MARVITQLVFIAAVLVAASAAPVIIGGTYFGEDTVVEEAPVEVMAEIPPNSAEITGTELIQATGIKLHGVHNAHHAAAAKPAKGKAIKTRKRQYLAGKASANFRFCRMAAKTGVMHAYGRKHCALGIRRFHLSHGHKHKLSKFKKMCKTAKYAAQFCGCSYNKGTHKYQGKSCHALLRGAISSLKKLRSKVAPKKVKAKAKKVVHPVKKPVKHKIIAKSSGNLYQNCMTTKAYAMSKADYIVEQTDRNLGVVKNFLIALAKKGDCLSQFRQWSKMAMLNFDAKDSINKHLARLIRFRMIHRHGILTWHRNKVYVSGKKIGLTGDVDLLSRGNLVATSFEVQRLMYKISGGKSHAIVEGKVNKFGKPVAKVKNPYTVKDADTLLKGQCQGAVSLFCGRYTKAGRRVCITTGCQWRGPWNGREEEEIAVSVPPPEWQGNEEQ